MMDENQLSIDALPDEILLNIFRMLSANEVVMYIPLVCEKWSRIIASDSFTLQRIGMYHTRTVMEFFYFRDERERSEMFHCPQWDFEQLMQTFMELRYGDLEYRDCLTPLEVYENVFCECARYEICKRITTLVMSSHICMFAILRLTYIDRLTTLVFFNVSFHKEDQYTLAEMDYVRDVMYVKCSVDPSFNLKFLHRGFSCLRRFRADQNSLDIHFLEYMLHKHRQTLEMVELFDCSVSGDEWINVLSQRLRGRTINRLTMRSPYFTDKRVKQFMATADLVLPDDKSNVIIDNTQIGCRDIFFIDIDPIII